MGAGSGGSRGSRRDSTIGSAIAVSYHRHPYTLAAAAAQIDRLSGERLVLGIGTGHRAGVETLLHIDWGDAPARLRDYLAAVRACLDADGPIEHRNDHFHIGPRAQQVPHKAGSDKACSTGDQNPH